MKTPSEADHQVVRPLQVCKLVADVQEKTLGETGLEIEHLVESVEIASVIDDVVADSYSYRENRHYQLCPE